MSSFKYVPRRSSQLSSTLFLPVDSVPCCFTAPGSLASDSICLLFFSFSLTCSSLLTAALYCIFISLINFLMVSCSSIPSVFLNLYYLYCLNFLPPVQTLTFPSLCYQRSVYSYQLFSHRNAQQSIYFCQSSKCTSFYSRKNPSIFTLIGKLIILLLRVFYNYLNFFYEISPSPPPMPSSLQ